MQATRYDKLYWLLYYGCIVSVFTESNEEHVHGPHDSTLVAAHNTAIHDVLWSGVSRNRQEAVVPLQVNDVRQTTKCARPPCSTRDTGFLLRYETQSGNLLTGPQWPWYGYKKARCLLYGSTAQQARKKKGTSTQKRTGTPTRRRREKPQPSGEADKPKQIDPFQLFLNGKISKHHLQKYTTENAEGYYDVWKKRIKEVQLSGIDLPYSLISDVTWEMLKLFGRIGDPLWPYCALPISSNIFLSRLFGGKDTIDENKFKLLIEREWNFLMPKSSDFLYEKAHICWHGWMQKRSLSDVPDSTTTSKKGVKLERIEGTVEIPIVIRRTNKEINQQGVHPSILHAFWEYFAEGNAVIHPDTVLSKLFSNSTVIGRRQFVDSDSFIQMLEPSMSKAFNAFDFQSYTKYHNKVMNEKAKLEEALRENAAIRQKHKLDALKSKEQLRKLFEPNIKSLIAEQ